jgi:hypothetical protein
MRIGVAADHGGFELKVKLTSALKAAGHDVVDFGAHELVVGMPPVFISVTRHSLDLTASMPVYNRRFLDPGRASGRGRNPIGSVNRDGCCSCAAKTSECSGVQLRCIPMKELQ